MRKYYFILFYILNTVLTNAQCTIVIKQIGKPSDSLMIYGYELLQQSESYVKINDSTLVINSKAPSPDRLCYRIDKKTRWSSFVWIEPSVNYKEITIDYNKHKISVNSKGTWDSITNITCNLDDKNQYKEELAVINAYVDGNTDSYLSLWWFTHTTVFSVGNISEKKNIFNKLSLSLSKYSEYRQVKADLVGREYPKLGDAFKEFSLVQLTDSVFKTESIKNKWILLNFWSTSCVPCIKEIDSLISFNNAIDSSKAKIISISFDNNQGKWKNSIHTKKINWTSVWQIDGFYGELGLHYNVYSMPFFILFDRDKKLLMIRDGSNELNNIKNIFKEKQLLK